MSKLNFNEIKTFPLKKRKSKVSVNLFSKPCKRGDTLKDFFKNLPEVLAVKSLKDIARAMIQARGKSKPIIFGIGAHVIKCGLGPVLIDLMKKGWINTLAMNGATAIHDFELALTGQTSEDVDEALEEGRFGMVRETGEMINEALIQGYKRGLGAGESLASYIQKGKTFKYKEISVLAQSNCLKIPVTIHIAIGTDIIHQHPSCQGKALGETSMIDFKKMCELVSDIGEGGVFICFGSSVILPEVFLKAISVARNLKGNINNFTTAYFDMIRHYRPSENIVRRPVLSGGHGYYVIGHHEIMLPLLACAILEMNDIKEGKE